MKRAPGSIRRRGATWSLRYVVDGAQIEESAGTGDERAARALLAQRRREIRDGTWTRAEQRTGNTVRAYLEPWIERRDADGVCGIDDERRHVADFIAAHGNKSLDEVRRLDVKSWVATVAAREKRGGGLRAPRTINNCYSTIATAFHDAVRDGLLLATPCTLTTRRGELPKKRDANPKWRTEAVYSREEAEQLVSDDRIPLDRRILYLLQLATGARSSEANAITWAMYDAAALPLGRITIAVQTDGASASRETKTLTVREVPAVPLLASQLADWKRVGFPMTFGWHPRLSDPIVPARASKFDAVRFRGKHTWDTLIDDMERIGMRRVPSPRHAMRATFLTMLELDGAAMGIASRATHAARGDVVSGYLRPQWADVCREVGKLRLEIRRSAKVLTLPLRKAVGDAAIPSASAGAIDSESRDGEGGSSLRVVGKSMGNEGSGAGKPPRSNNNPSGRDRDRTCDPLRVKQLLCR